MRAPRIAGLSWLAAPYVGAALLLVVIPLVMTAYLALTQYDALSEPRFVGLDNFRKLARDPLFSIALDNSLLFAAISVPLRMFVAFALALMLARPGPATALARPLVYLPSVLPEIAYALLWLWLLNPLYGPLARLESGTSLLLTPWGARGALIGMSLLQVGEVFIVLLATRRELPRELYELCAVEGGSSWVAFRRITLPMMWPALLILAARDAALTLQTTFVPALVITKGGPLYATTFLPLYAYQSGFEYLRFGYASAMTLITVGLTLAMLGAQAFIVWIWRSPR